LNYLLLDDRCKSTSPPSSQEKNSTQDNLHQLLPEQSLKDRINPSHSLSPTNEETTSSFSGWDDQPSSSNDKQQDSIKQITSDCYYPSHPCDLAFTVNMTTTDTKSIASTIDSQQKMIANFRPIKFNLARKLIAETSESEISIQNEPWTQNIVYQSKNLQRTRLSSSYNNLSK